jgi:hypothetical protein
MRKESLVFILICPVTFLAGPTRLSGKYIFVYLFLEPNLFLEKYNYSLLFYVRLTSFLGSSLTSNGFALTSWQLHL